MLYALISILAGAASLYLGWKQRLPARPARLAGWTLLVTGAGLMMRAQGVEFGLIYACLFAACAAWVCVGLEAERWQPAARRRSRGSGSAASVAEAEQAAWQHHGLNFLFAILIGGSASMFVAVLVSQWLPWPVVERITFVVLITPLIWGGVMVWTLASPRVARLVVTGVCVVTGLSLLAR